MKSLEYERERLELRRLRGELGQMGGLLKQALVGGADKVQVGMYLRGLDKCRADIQALIAKLSS